MHDLVAKMKGNLLVKKVIAWTATSRAQLRYEIEVAFSLSRPVVSSTGMIAPTSSSASSVTTYGEMLVAKALPLNGPNGVDS